MGGGGPRRLREVHRRPTEAPTGAGTASVLIDLKKAGAAYGEFTLVAGGILAVSDPDTFDSESLAGRLVALQAAQVVMR